MVGGYHLDLYCDGYDAARQPVDGVHELQEFPHTFTGELGAACRRQARRQGWLLSEKQQLCPKCSGKKPRRMQQLTIPGA